VAALIADLRAWFPSGVRWTWQISPLDRPSDLAARLAAAGFAQVNRLPAMALDLTDVSSRPALSVDVREVRAPADLEAWLTVRHANHPLDEATRHAWLRTQPPIPDPALRQFVARAAGGRPAGSMTLFLDGETAGLYHVDVIASARGQGIGTAMTLAALTAAKASGARVVLLTATELGMRLYRRLGFLVAGPVEVLASVDV
jgi:ribosomal protein S18 acetylase RimI-like enzyme